MCPIGTTVMTKRGGRAAGRISRRAFVRSALAAGVGASAYALTGCSDPLRELPEDHDSTMSRTDPPARAVASSGSGLPADPVAWRERYHWSTIPNADLPASDPGGALTVLSEGLPDWSPFTPFPAPQLSAFYGRLLTRAVPDGFNAHANHLSGDLGIAAEAIDETTFTFRIAAGRRWRDLPPLNGRALLASDVAATYAAYADYGGNKFAPLRNLARIDADDHAATVTITLAERDASFVSRLADPDWVILPAEMTVEPERFDTRRASYGTGPFRLEYGSAGNWRAWRSAPPAPHAAGIELLRGDAASGYSTTLDGAIRQLHRHWAKDRIDVIDLPSAAEHAEALDSHPDARTQVTAPVPGAGPHFQFRSVASGSFADARVRAALSRALNRGALADGFYQGLAAPDCGLNWTFEPSTETIWGRREWPWDEAELGPAYQRDPDTAIALLEAAGYSAQNPLELRIDAPAEGLPDPPRALHRTAADAVGADFKRVFGSAVRITPVPRAPFVPPTVEQLRAAGGSAYVAGDQISERADLQFAFGLPGYPGDPDDHVYEALATDGRFNSMAASDPQLDALAIAQRRELDPDHRGELLGLFRQRAAEMLFRLHLVNPYRITMRREYVRNVVSTHLGSGFASGTNWYELAWREPKSG